LVVELGDLTVYAVAQWFIFKDGRIPMIDGFRKLKKVWLKFAALPISSTGVTYARNHQPEVSMWHGDRFPQCLTANYGCVGNC
jgi:hypothetical protein